MATKNPRDDADNEPENDRLFFSKVRRSRCHSLLAYELMRAPDSTDDDRMAARGHLHDAKKLLEECDGVLLTRQLASADDLD